MKYLRGLILAVGLFAFPQWATAEGIIQMGRMPDISPDGKSVVFSYHGDLWSVESLGGTARPITMHKAHDVLPSFSPDGSQVAFSSNRFGSYDVFLIPARSGRPTRLTFDSANDLVCGWSPDGKSILFASTRNDEYPTGYELYSISVDGGRVHRQTYALAKWGAYSPSGDQLAYVRGPGSWYRKGYRGSSNDDIWLANADGSHNRRLTTFNGQDRSPMWTPDEKYLYYVSERFGTPANLVRLSLDEVDANPSAKLDPTPVTKHKEEGVRRARMSRDGRFIVYECGVDLWIVSTEEGAEPRKLWIEVFTDDKSNSERLETFTGKATEYALTKDEKHIAFAIHGELFMMPVKTGAKAVRLTETGVNNHAIAWAPDNNSIVFLSDRDGHDNLYKIVSDDKEHPKLVDAHRFKTTKLTDFTESIFGVSYSPDGKQVIFIRANRLWTMNPDGSGAKMLVKEGAVFDYDWAPDSKWIVYARRDAAFSSELYIIPSTGATPANPARNITRYATLNGDVTWSADGRTIAFLSRRGSSDDLTMYVLPLRKDAAPGVTDPKPGRTPTVTIDWDYIHLRAKRVSSVAVQSAAISPDGKKIAFRASDKGTDLWLANTDGSSLTRLTTGSQNPKQIRWSRRRLGSSYLSVLYYRDSKGMIHLLRPSTDSKKPSTKASLGFKIKMRIRTEEEFQEMFDQSWRFLAANFYDSNFHGSDWDRVRERYRPVVQHLTMKEDLYSVLYLMMGELNASHLGVSGYRTTPDEPTAHLGLFFDENYKGDGLRVLEILKRGPADKRGLKLSPGDFILAIDGEPVKRNTNLAKLLNGKIGEVVSLTVASSVGESPKDKRTVEIKATTPGSTTSGLGIRDLMYERWVERNAERVHTLSGGKLGYIHIPSMDQKGLDRFVRSLYSDNFDKEGILLDVRFNGGGYTHDKVLNYLGGKEHTFFQQRDGARGLVLRSSDRKWTKPVVVTINNRSYSDAEIFPNAFRTLGFGKVVGQATGGHVIGTTSLTLIDGSKFRIPRTGVFTTKDVNMDKQGVVPDVAVENHPDELLRGLDAQLKKAVEVLRTDVSEWKKKNGSDVAAKE